MRGAARRTRSRGTRSCIAFFRPVEDQTHTKVWSEGRAVQPPLRGRGHRDPHRTKADASPCLLQADMDFSAHVRSVSDLSAVCQRRQGRKRCSVQWVGLRPAPHTAPSSTAIPHTAQLLGVEQFVAGIAAVIYVWTCVIGLAPLAEAVRGRTDTPTSRLQALSDAEPRIRRYVLSAEQPHGLLH